MLQQVSLSAAIMERYFSTVADGARDLLLVFGRETCFTQLFRSDFVKFGGGTSTPFQTGGSIGDSVLLGFPPPTTYPCACSCLRDYPGISPCSISEQNGIHKELKAVIASNVDGICPGCSNKLLRYLVVDIYRVSSCWNAASVVSAYASK